MTYAKLLDADSNVIYGNDGKAIWVQDDAKSRIQSPWKTTITIFNKRIDAKNKQVKWYVTVLHNCFWSTSIDASKRGGGFQAYASDERFQHKVPNILVRIPYQRKYQTPEEWNEYPNGFTVKPDDIIFKGIVADPFNGRTVNEALDAYGLNAFVVKYVSDNIEKSDFVKHIHAEGY